jgi:hypothetical protein
MKMQMHFAKYSTDQEKDEIKKGSRHIAYCPLSIAY